MLSKVIRTEDLFIHFDMFNAIHPLFMIFAEKSCQHNISLFVDLSTKVIKVVQWLGN